ncbi:MAG: hypothetical protein ACKOPU_05620 [Candidatus Planktophila sp.]
MAIVGDYNSCGSRSAFYIIDEGRGFKEFDDKESAEYAHGVQSKLSQYNLAPKVLSDIGKIRYRDNLELSRWGYISEMAEIIGCGGNECSCGDCDDDLPYQNQNKIDKLIRKIDDLGLEFMDAHIGNVGYIRRNGKKVLVCIDCGEESVYDADVSDDDNDYEDDYCGCEMCKQRKRNNV